MGMTNIASAGARFGRRIALAATAALTAGVLLASTASAATSPWTIVPSANLGTTTSNQFHGVAMVDSTHGFAVGGAGPQATIESWAHPVRGRIPDERRDDPAEPPGSPPTTSST